jgi:hypothetical protein
MSDIDIIEDDEFDLDAVAAETAKAPLRFRWQGRSWALKHRSQIDWRIVESAATGDVQAIREVFRLGLGDEQAERFDEIEQPMDAMTALFHRWNQHNGTSEGESSASDASSASTETQSRPASKRSTRSASATSSTAPSRRAV